MSADYPGSRSSSQFEGHISTTEPVAEPAQKGRRAPRRAVKLDAGLRQRGATGVSVQIMDLSTEGFRVGSHLNLAPGTDVWIRLPGLEAVQARVMWCERNLLGCAFQHALHPAVLEMIIARNAAR
jgi:hypothetical protein